MILYINNQKIEFSEEELNLRYLEEGQEGTAYVWDDKVIKIYKNQNRIPSINEETALYLSKIPTKRILLPIDLVYDENHKFIGYTTKFILNHQREVIKRLPVSTIKKELELIREDIFLLSEKGVSLMDFHLDNFAYNGGFYMIDPGTYKVVDYDKKKVFLENIRYYSEFFLRDLIFSTIKFTKKEKEFLDLLNDSCDFISDILDNSNRKVVPYLKGISK